MKTKQLYLKPATELYSMTISVPLLQLGSPAPTATFISNPGVGDAETGDEIGTESRSMSDGTWDD